MNTLGCWSYIIGSFIFCPGVIYPRKRLIASYNIPLKTFRCHLYNWGTFPLLPWCKTPTYWPRYWVILQPKLSRAYFSKQGKLDCQCLQILSCRLCTRNQANASYNVVFKITTKIGRKNKETDRLLNIAEGLLDPGIFLSYVNIIENLKIRLTKVVTNDTSTT